MSKPIYLAIASPQGWCRQNFAYGTCRKHSALPQRVRCRRRGLQPSRLYHRPSAATRVGRTESSKADAPETSDTLHPLSDYLRSGAGSPEPCGATLCGQSSSLHSLRPSCIDAYRRNGGTAFGNGCRRLSRYGQSDGYGSRPPFHRHLGRADTDYGQGQYQRTLPAPQYDRGLGT